MTGRDVDLRYRLKIAEQHAAQIVADKKLREMRDFQPDPAWKSYFSDAIDAARHASDFADVRFWLKVAASGEMDADEAHDKAEKILRRFDNDRRYLAEALARWDADAQKRRAQKERTRSKWPQAVADHLAKNVGGTKDNQWEAIPEGDGEDDGIFLTIDGEQAEVYRDGDKLCCNSRAAGPREIARVSFHRRYLKAVKGH